MPVTPNRELDLLLLIDDSPTTPEFQNPLSRAIPALFDALSLGGELPSLHIGVATSDLGTTGSDDPSQPGPPIGQLNNGGCAGHGKDGELITSGAAVSDAFVVDEVLAGGARRRNYQGTLGDVVGQMIKAGGGGCGFEQHFAAFRRALTNPRNNGFLRPAAQLGIVILADEDDCSFRTPRLVDPNEPIGPLQSYRCTVQGVTCNEPIDVAGIKTGCHARADSTYIESLSPTLDLLRSIKPDPSMLGIIAIASPVVPFEVGPLTPPGGGQPLLAVYDSCGVSGPNTFLATNPSVRIRDLVASFDARGAYVSSCALSYDAQVLSVGRLLKQGLGVACLDTTKLRDSDTAAGIQPACTAVLVTGGVEEPLPACPADGACFEIVADPAACAETTDHLRFIVHDAPANAYVRGRCEVP